MVTAKPQIAKRIKEAREWKGLSQVAMAKRLGIARQTYLDLETGKTEPRITVLLSIAALTERPVSWFMAEESTHATERCQPDMQPLLSLYRQLPEPLRSQLLTSHIGQLKACLDYLHHHQPDEAACE